MTTERFLNTYHIASTAPSPDVPAIVGSTEPIGARSRAPVGLRRALYIWRATRVGARLAVRPDLRRGRGLKVTEEARE